MSGAPAPPEPAPGSVVGFSRSERRLVAVSVLLTVGSAVTRYVGAGRVVPFVVSALALASLAAIVGRSVEHLGERMGPGPTGVLQSALGNLPELFFGIFALRAGLVTVVQTALVGSILANLLLILGLAFVAGGLRHGTQRFDAPPVRDATMLLVLAVAILMIPTLSSHLALPVAHHEVALSNVAAVILLVVFVLSVVAGLRYRPASPPAATAPGTGGSFGAETPERTARGSHWPVWLLVTMLVGSAVGAAFVSQWFVDALTPALGALHISQSFAGLVVVAIAGNAVENVVGVQLALQNRPEYALSVILQSPVQIAFGLIPVLVLLSPVLGGAQLTLVLPLLLVVALAIGTVVAVIVVYDGESTWLEGVALIGLYAAIAAAFWWG